MGSERHPIQLGVDAATVPDLHGFMTQYAPRFRDWNRTINPSHVRLRRYISALRCRCAETRKDAQRWRELLSEGSIST